MTNKIKLNNLIFGGVYFLLISCQVQEKENDTLLKLKSAINTWVVSRVYEKDKLSQYKNALKTCVTSLSLNGEDELQELVKVLSSPLKDISSKSRSNYKGLSRIIFDTDLTKGQKVLDKSFLIWCLLSINLDSHKKYLNPIDSNIKAFWSLGTLTSISERYSRVKNSKVIVQAFKEFKIDQKEFGEKIKYYLEQQKKYQKEKGAEK